MYLVMALVAGGLVIVCIKLLGELSLKVGYLQAGLSNFVLGGIASICVYYMYRLSGFNEPSMVNFSPLYLLGGFIGALIMVLNSIVIRNISAVHVTSLILTGQLVVGIVIDYFVHKQIGIEKMRGSIFFLLGIIIYSMNSIKKYNA